MWFHKAIKIDQLVGLQGQPMQIAAKLVLLRWILGRKWLSFSLLDIYLVLLLVSLRSQLIAAQAPIQVAAVEF